MEHVCRKDRKRKQSISDIEPARQTTYISKLIYNMEHKDNRLSTDNKDKKVLKMLLNESDYTRFIRIISETTEP